MRVKPIISRKRSVTKAVCVLRRTYLEEGIACIYLLISSGSMLISTCSHYQELPVGTKFIGDMEAAHRVCCIFKHFLFSVTICLNVLYTSGSIAWRNGIAPVFLLEDPGQGSLQWPAIWVSTELDIQ